MLALLALIAAAFASAATPPPPLRAAKPGKVTKVGQSNPSAPTAAGQVHAIGYRLTAQRAPTGTTSQCCANTSASRYPRAIAGPAQSAPRTSVDSLRGLITLLPCGLRAARAVAV